jgi:hypothetical protein
MKNVIVFRKIIIKNYFVSRGFKLLPLILTKINYYNIYIYINILIIRPAVGGKDL